MKVDLLIAELDRRDARMAELMPDEKAALNVMFAAYDRLRKLGFKDAIYCPKDGTTFEAIEAGCTSIGIGSYSGKWPDGQWWMHEEGDFWPSRPILYRPLKKT